MRRAISLALAALGLVGGVSLAAADPDRDESRRGGRDRGGYERMDRVYGHYPGHRRRGGREAVRIPRGHLPPPGECRVWYPNRPAGHQPPPRRC